MWERLESISSFDVSSSGDLGVHAENDMIYLWSDLSLSGVRGIVRGHLLDTYTLRFFPSDKVVISGGADFTLRIWSLEHLQQTLEPGNSISPFAVQMTGHSGGILSVDFIDRGKKLISSSMDGTVKLWDVPTQITDFTFGEANRKHVRSAIVHDSSVWSGNDSGKLSQYDIRDKSLISQASVSSGINVVRCFNEFVLVGTDDGNIINFDSRKIEEPLSTIKSSNISVLSLENNEENDTFFVSTGDCQIKKFNITLESGDIEEKEKINIQQEHIPISFLKPRNKALFYTCKNTIHKISI